MSKLAVCFKQSSYSLNPVKAVPNRLEQHIATFSSEDEAQIFMALRARHAEFKRDQEEPRWEGYKPCQTKSAVTLAGVGTWYIKK